MIDLPCHTHLTSPTCPSNPEPGSLCSNYTGLLTLLKCSRLLLPWGTCTVPGKLSLETPAAHPSLFLKSVLKCHLLMTPSLTILFETANISDVLAFPALFSLESSAVPSNRLYNWPLCQSFSTGICTLNRQVFTYFLQRCISRAYHSVST